MVPKFTWGWKNPLGPVDWQVPTQHTDGSAQDWRITFQLGGVILSGGIQTNLDKRRDYFGSGSEMLLYIFLRRYIWKLLNNNQTFPWVFTISQTIPYKGVFEQFSVICWNKWKPRDIGVKYLHHQSTGSQYITCWPSRGEGWWGLSIVLPRWSFEMVYFVPSWAIVPDTKISPCSAHSQQCFEDSVCVLLPYV